MVNGWIAGLSIDVSVTLEVSRAWASGVFACRTLRLASDSVGSIPFDDWRRGDH